MQLSMGTLYSPSSKAVKDSTPPRPCRRRILRCINFDIGEFLPNLFLNMVKLYLVKFEARWILNAREFYFSLFSLFESESWPTKSKSAWWISTQLYFRGGESWPNCYRKKVNGWWILTYRFCWKSEQRWRLEVDRFEMPFYACIRI